MLQEGRMSHEWKPESLYWYLKMYKAAALPQAQ